MSWNNIKIDPADSMFSKYIRLKAKKCAKCGRMGTGELGIEGLQASHYKGRRCQSVRFDQENVDVLCAGCHKYFTENKKDYDKWKEEEMGTKNYNLLLIRANTTGKKDYLLQRMIWKKLLKEDFNI